MTWLQIIHETAYTYRRAVRFGPHRLVLRPREGHDIRVAEMSFEIEPMASLGWSRDVFGNSVAHAIFHEPAEILRIRNRVVLQQTVPFPARVVSPSVPYPLQYSDFESAVAAAYQATTFPADVPPVKEWVSGIAAHVEGADAEGVVALINRKVYESIRYNRREARGVQTPAETLQLGTGSCRDMATLLLEALRVLGFPTRFASGYLDCEASEAGCASTHAWAEVYFPEVGWLGFDPSTGQSTSAKHVVVGVSHHPRGVMPISGSFYGAPEEYLDMAVTVATERFEERPSSIVELASAR
jgi:transglutaminase-like putative cysteine protease